MESTLYLSSSPHVHEGGTTAQAMRAVIYALLPCVGVWIFSFGLQSILVMLLCIVGCVVAEAVCQKMMGRAITIADGSAAMTGILLAFNIPPNSSWWMAILGGIVSIVVGKQVFGGLGYNSFNPALIGRTVLLISFPVQMTTWVMPRSLEITSATPLSELKMAVGLQGAIPDELKAQLGSVVMGGFGGQLGVISGLALIAGGCYLLYRKIITWHIPGAYIGSALILSGILWAVDSSKYPSPVFHLFTGGLLLGAIFMATDWVTTPITTRGMLIFGTGCGVLTILIRVFGGYPEGVAFSILLMNAATPVIDRFTVPKKFGLVPEKG